MTYVSTGLKIINLYILLVEGGLDFHDLNHANQSFLIKACLEALLTVRVWLGLTHERKILWLLISISIEITLPRFICMATIHYKDLGHHPKRLTF